MGCFPCFDSKEEETLNPQKQPNDRKDSHPTLPTNISRLSSGADRFKSRSNVGAKREQPGIKELADAQIAAQTFTFRELAAATNNFRPESFIGEGGFRRVYKGRLQTTGQRSKAQLEMGCFPCFGSKVEEDSHPTLPINTSGLSSDRVKSRSNVSVKKEHAGIKEPSYAQIFTFRELVAATNNFRPESLLGEGGFGRVYKGMLESTNQVVAVKQLDRDGLQGNREFLIEVLMLSHLHNSNIVNLIGYCAEGDQRLLVYEFMPLGSLEDHLHDLPPDKEPLDWNTRMKIAAGAAKGLEFLHDKLNPPVIYRDCKSSNILLGEGFHPKLSDLGLAKLGPVGDKSYLSDGVAGTYGYLAPDYAKTGQLTVQSDVYSFGVVLLELITGRKALDITQPQGQQYLVTWARSLFIDHRKFAKLADPRLQGQYPMRGLYQAVAVASMCIQEQSADRPLIHNVVAAISNLANHAYELSSALGHGYGDRDDKMTEVVEDS